MKLMDDRYYRWSRYDWTIRDYLDETGACERQLIEEEINEAEIVFDEQVEDYITFIIEGKKQSSSCPSCL